LLLSTTTVETHQKQAAALPLTRRRTDGIQLNRKEFV